MNQTLGHVVSSCSQALRDGRYNWRHDSVIRCIARAILKPENLVYADIAEFPTPSTITGDQHRPDIVVVRANCLYVLELTVGFETNLKKNYERKDESYGNLLITLRDSYDGVEYMNLSMSALGCVSKMSKNLTT